VPGVEVDLEPADAVVVGPVDEIVDRVVDRQGHEHRDEHRQDDGDGHHSDEEVSVSRKALENFLPGTSASNFS